MEKSGLMFMDIVINRAHAKLLSHAPELYIGIKQGICGTARVDDQLDQYFYLLLELLLFD